MLYASSGVAIPRYQAGHILYKKERRAGQGQLIYRFCSSHSNFLDEVPA